MIDDVDLPQFLLARVEERERAGRLHDFAALRQRQDIVRHRAPHVCEDGLRNDPDEAAGIPAYWCQFLREMAVAYSEHPGYRDEWQPCSDPFWGES